MSDVDNVQEEVVTQDTQHEPSIPPSTNTVESRQDRNWRQMRQRQDDLERELRLKNDMLENMMKQAVKPEVDELEAVSDAEFIPKGQVNRLVEKRAQKIAEDVVRREQEKFKAEQHHATFLTRLKSQYSDYDDVVTNETMALLEEQDPELVQTIVASKDPYKIGLQAYKFIKAAGIVDKVPNSRRVKEVEKKLVENSKTVQSPLAYEKRPLAQAMKMTKSDEKSLYEEMMGHASRSGYSY